MSVSFLESPFTDYSHGSFDRYLLAVVQETVKETCIIGTYTTNNGYMGVDMKLR